MSPLVQEVAAEDQRTWVTLPGSFIMTKNPPEWPWFYVTPTPPAPAPEPRATVPDSRLRRLARHLHLLGERSVYELLREIIVAGLDPVERLEVYARLDADIMEALGADRLPNLRTVQ